VLFRISDPRVTEASGVARGIASPSVVYVQNDSGDQARFFALDIRTGTTLATYSVPGATNVDWEDLAVARDRRGVPSVWIADIGDNDTARAEVRVYRVDEPQVGVAGKAPTGPDVWRLRYPGGPVDAEGLTVAPGGAGYIFTKSIFGATEVYALPARPDAAKVQTVRRIGEISFRPTGTPGGPNIVGQVTATGAALSGDGSVLAVRTYTDAYLWRVPDGDVARALRSDPVRIVLPQQPQGEGIAIDGNRLLVDSEGADSSVLAVPMPRLPTAPPTTSRPTPTATGSPSPARGSSSPAGGSSSPARGSSSPAGGSSSRITGPGFAIGVVVLLAIAAGAWTLRRRARPSRTR
jgi:hypothetical protein